MSRHLNIFTLYFFMVCCEFLRWSRADIFSSLTDVETLLETQQIIIEDLSDYLIKEEKRILILKKHLHIFIREHSEAMKDVSKYLGNPVKAFTLIKRLTIDINEIEQTIKKGTAGYINNTSINHGEVKYPTLEDLSGAALALARLQKTYQLSITELSEGILNGTKYSTPMSSSDCYEVGKALYVDEDYKNSIAWLELALRKYKENLNEVFSDFEVELMEYISFSYYLIKDYQSALEWTSKILAIDKSNSFCASDVPYFTKLLKQQNEEDRHKLQNKNGSNSDKPAPEKLEYETLCRGGMEIPSEVSNKLTCRYLTDNHPFLRLAPIKMEQYYILPDIILFYDVMSDDEIEVIKKIAKPRLQRAFVYDPHTGESTKATYRISKSTWLSDEEDEVIPRITRRIADFTGLNMYFAEQLQVANYGIAGHYKPHLDFARKSEQSYIHFDQQRIATVLFYMSDVAQGGATVFTELNLTVFPIKNAAIFWYNLHPSGEGDLATQHAACPVLRGSKWVSTKWIVDAGQELIKPCDLDYQEEGIIRKQPS